MALDYCIEKHRNGQKNDGELPPAESASAKMDKGCL
jgi:hypothetical protein